MIPHEYIEELTRRTDIVDLVGSYVQLKRKGRLYGGLCPFHSEKTPSFYVYPDTQSFYCFGCGAGGDAITFAKKINSISYGEAVKLLAGRAGMPERSMTTGMSFCGSSASSALVKSRLMFSEKSRSRRSSSFSGVSAGFKSISIRQEETSSGRQALAERMSGPETPKCVKSISPCSRYKTLSPRRSVSPTFRNDSPCIRAQSLSASSGTSDARGGTMG